MPENVVQQPAAQAAATQAQTPAQAAPKAEDIANALLSALDTRTQRAERSVTKSFAEQYGLSEEEINGILAKAKAEKDAKIPDAAQAEINKQIAQAHKILVAAEVRAKGSAMGLVDADTAILLMNMENVKVDDKGAVSGVEDALTALKEAKPFLFTAQPTGQKTDVGGKVTSTPPGGEASARDEIKKILFGGN